VITGASSGIGAAIAREFGAGGYKVVAMARRSERLTELSIPAAHYCVVDLHNHEEAEVALREAELACGPVGLLVNNAGVLRLAPVAEQSRSDLEEMFSVNCISAMSLTSLVLPGMMTRGRGTIVNIGSIAGHRTYEHHAGYCATKSALHAFSEATRKEAAPFGVRVITIAPGFVDTELGRDSPETDITRAYSEHKMRLGGGLTAELIARTVRSSYELPPDVCIREIVIAPTAQID
jgi:NADP-dependent 3-hydroxy acid dehydrogenase YdfG